MAEDSRAWWRDAVVYQIYPRSFQDSDGDGVGDLRGIEQRLDHLSDLGADAFWLSPVYPSPLADFGYDVADYEDVDPQFGSLSDYDSLVRAAHGQGLKVLMDLVPSHTSRDHRWFREHPDWYIWAPGKPAVRESGPVEGARGNREVPPPSATVPPNNWVAAFGGSAWTRDDETGRWYLHSFYPEQPDVDWRNPEVVRAMQGVVRFWLERGTDGFRLDAIPAMVKDVELRDDPPATAPFVLPLHEEYGRLEHVYSANRPEVGEALAKLREAAADAVLVGEAYVSTADLPRYLEHVDLAFVFEFLHAPWNAERLRDVIEEALPLDGLAWVLSNHDFPRVATRFGEENVRAAAVLLLTLPGAAFIYQGDEIGLRDGPGTDPPFDRAGRDGARHPMQWDAGPNGGFTTGRPWLPPVDAARRNVEAQRDDPGSVLNLYRRLIALRRALGDDFRFLSAPEGVLRYERGRHHVAVNVTGEPRPLAPEGRVVLETHPGAEPLAPHAAVVSERD